MKKILLPIALLTLMMFVSCDQAPVYEEVTVAEVSNVLTMISLATQDQGADPDGNYTFTNYDLTQVNDFDPSMENYILLNGTALTSDNGNTVYYDFTMTGGPVFTLECTLDGINFVYTAFIANGHDMTNAMNGTP